jgi:2-polyprenyl-3-methyl-5-hydroxy-6-metoxy-1,4-benzoquinol methylase
VPRREGHRQDAGDPLEPQGGTLQKEADMKIWTGESDRSWEALARENPYYGVLSKDRFRGRRLDESARDEFFASGEQHVAAVLDDVRRLDPDFAPERVLDFGCGVGRLLIPFARRFRQVAGVDVSHVMLREAQANCQAEGLKNVELLPSDDALSAVRKTYDLVHSFVVLQHIPVRRGERIVRALVARLAEGGIGALHVTYSTRTALRRMVHDLQVHVPLLHNVVNLVRGRPFGEPMMQINPYRLDRFFGILHEGGCELAFVRATRHDSQPGAMIYFRKAPVDPL